MKSSFESHQSFSALRLAGILVLLFGGLYVIYAFPLYISAMYVAGFLMVIILYDRRIIFRFVYKPAFWIGLLVISTLTGFFLGGVQGSAAFSTDGLRIGIEMNMRAVVVIAGFGAVSVQLRNPVLMQWFENKRMKNFYLPYGFHSRPYRSLYL